VIINYCLFSQIKVVISSNIPGDYQYRNLKIILHENLVIFIYGYYLADGWDSPIRDLGDKIPHIVTYSHKHEDHYDSMRLSEAGVIRYFGGEALHYKDLCIESIPMSEEVAGTPDNNGYLMTYKDIKVLHMGDCQANIIGLHDPGNKSWLSEQLPPGCDVVLFPIEGKKKYMEEAIAFMEHLDAKIYTPMHYWSISYRDTFLKKPPNLVFDRY
jgi:hypothetical protein